MGTLSDNAWDQVTGPTEILFAVSGMNRTPRKPVQLRSLVAGHRHAIIEA